MEYIPKQSSKVKRFIEDIKALCRENSLSISHEDTQGAFIITEYDEENIRWLEHAFDKTMK
ncbi:MAG: hypothetical protein ACTSPN_04030 [Promethearchaeota archaeon]